MKNNTISKTTERKNLMVQILRLLGGGEITADTINETPGILLVKLIFSKFSEYRLYGGIRATLVFNPRGSLPTSNELYKLCEELQPLMNKQLWQKWHPIYIPMSSKQIDVIGFEKHTLLDNEEFDIAFPSLKKIRIPSSKSDLRKF